MNQLLRVAAIYTTYRPDDGFRHRIHHVLRSCAITVVVDNTPGGHTFAAGQTDGLIVLQDGCNKGLGAALNLGLAAARQHGCEAVVLFDQDSSPDPNFLDSLLAGLIAAGHRTIVGPLLIDDANGGTQTFMADVKPRFEETTCIATSGMCFYLDGLNPSDRFTEDFFLDFVDFDWCWRQRGRHWRICRLVTLTMPHRLGLAQRKFLGLTYHIPAPYRHYFQFRDSLKLATQDFVPIYSRIRLTVILLPKLLIYPFLLDRGMERLRWMLMGIRDFRKAVHGIGAAASKLQDTSSRNS